jgi:hypothetical protein
MYWSGCLKINCQLYSQSRFNKGVISRIAKAWEKSK